MGLKEDFKELSARREKAGLDGLKAAAHFRSLDTIEKELKKQKTDKDFEKKKKEFQKNQSDEEKALKDQDASIKAWEEQLTKVSGAIKDQQDKAEIARKLLLQLSNEIDAENEKIKKYNESTAAKIKGKKPFMLKPDPAELVRIITKINETTKLLQEDKDWLQEYKNDAAKDKDKLQGLKKKLDGMKFSAKAKAGKK